MDSHPDYSKKSLLAFADTLGRKGLAKSNTARGLKVAATRILDDDVLDVREVDVTTAIRRYSNKNPGKLSPGTLAEYESRIGILIREFVKFHDDPTAYAGIGRDASGASRKERNSKAAPSSARGAPVTMVEFKTAPAPQATPRTGLTLEYPLRPDFLAQVVVPRDMKADEARRFCAFVMTLAADFTPKDA